MSLCFLLIIHCVTCYATLDDVVAAVGSEIGSYYHPVDILLSLNSSLSGSYKQLRVAGGFASLREALGDFWQYNQADLLPPTTFFTDLTRLFARRRDPEYIKLVKSVIARYIPGLSLTAWKFLPAGMRLRYAEYFTEILHYYVIPDTGKTRIVNGITVPVICELPLETSKAFFSVRQFDATLTFIRTRRWPNTTRVSVRCVDLVRGKAADMNIPGAADEATDYVLRLTPSSRVALQLLHGRLHLWRADSIHPVLVASHVKYFEHMVSDNRVIIRVSELRGGVRNYLVAYPLDLTLPFEQEHSEMHAHPGFSNTSVFPFKNCPCDLWIIPRIIGGWDLVEISKVRLLEFFSAIAVKFEATQPRQILLSSIFQNLEMFEETGDVTTRETGWSLIQEFLRGRPYESYRLRLLVAQTIRGDSNYNWIYSVFFSLLFDVSHFDHFDCCGGFKFPGR